LKYYEINLVINIFLSLSKFNLKIGIKKQIERDTQFRIFSNINKEKK